MLKLKWTVMCVSLALGVPGMLLAAPATLKEATEQAIMKNPEVLAKWHVFNAAAAEQDAARGGFRPRVDLTAGIGREHQVDPGQKDRDYTRRGVTLSLRQVLFDGFATSSEVKRLGYAKLAGYYDLLATTDDVALEAGRAYIDVLRYRKLAALARDNYGVHKGIFDQIEQRVKAGVGRRVDLEQAAGRLALAESNWLTDESNLHDVTARFQRIVGDLPAADLQDVPSLEKSLPAAADLMPGLLKRSPSFLAAVQNVRAARAEVDVRKSANLPSLELRARQDLSRNTDGVYGRHKTGVVELVLNYNLYNGGTDSARIRQFSERLNLAMDLRDKACRDSRQILSIAWSDVRKLREQLNYLEQHQLSTEKARDAYRKQFDIGQRTLLDLLDTENELFDARRSLVVAEYELQLAQLRVLGTSSTLLPALKLAPITDTQPAELSDDPADDNDRLSCGDTMVPLPVLDRKSVVVKPYVAVTADAPAEAPKPDAIKPMAGGSLNDTLLKLASDWSAAWSGKQVDAYLAFYADSFVPEGGLSRDQWAKQRRARLSKPGTISVKLEDVKVSSQEGSKARVQFRQVYQSADFSDTVNKTLELVQDGNKWRIVTERTAP